MVTACVPLGDASPFAVLGASTVTNTGPSVLTGDLGLSPGSSVTGFSPGIVLGAIHIADAAAANAQTSLTAAMITLAGLACDTDLTGQDLGTVGTLFAGVYCFSTSAQLTGTLTLDAQGDPDAVFVFQIGSTLTTATNSVVQLINGGETCNIYWLVGSSATLGTGTVFLGNILATVSITLNTGASIKGRALASTGAVTLDNNVITICPTCSGLICVHEATLVRTGDGTVPISAVYAGDLVFDYRNRATVVRQNIMSGLASSMVRIRSGALGPAQPCSDLLLRRGHPLLIEGMEVPCEELINGTSIDEVALDKPVKIYTLCTDTRTFVDMQGLLVATWKESDMDNFLQNDSYGRNLRIERQ